MMWRVLTVVLVVRSGMVAQGDEFTERASRTTAGAEANGESASPAVSANGRYVAFASRATNLGSPASTDADWDIFRKDMWTGEVVQVSRGQPPLRPDANADAVAPTISPDGRWVAFVSAATNLGSSGPVGVPQVWLWDSLGPLTGQQLAPVSTGAAGMGNGSSDQPSVTNGPFGPVVAFQSRATNLGVATSVGRWHVWCTPGTGLPLQLLSRVPFAAEGNGDSERPRAFVDAAFSIQVAFDSAATNLVVGDRDAVRDVFLVDALTGASTLLTRAAGVQSLSPATEPSPAADGRRIAFLCAGSELTGVPTNGLAQVQLLDRVAGTFSVVSRSTAAVANGPCSTPMLSADGNWVAFGSTATNLGIANPGGLRHAWLRGTNGVIRPLSWSDDLVPADRDTTGMGISRDGTWAVFASASALLENGDTNGVADVFVAFGGLRNLALPESGPGIVRNIRPSRLLERVGRYRPDIRDFSVEQIAQPGCAGDFRVTLVETLGGQSAVLHGVVDCAGTFRANQDLGQVIGSRTDIVGADTAADGTALIVTDQASTQVYSRSSTSAPFLPGCFSAGIVGSLGEVEIVEDGSAPLAAIQVYYANSATGAIESIRLCRDPVTGCYGCQHCSPTTCSAPVSEATSASVSIQLPPRSIVFTSTPVVGVGPESSEGDLFLFGSESGLGGIYHLTEGRLRGRASTAFLVDGLTFLGGGRVHGRVFVRGSDRRIWEFECVSMNASSEPAATGGVTKLVAQLPPAWLDRAGLVIVAFGRRNAGPPTPPAPVVLGTPLAFEVYAAPWAVLGSGSSPTFQYNLPGGLSPYLFKTQIFAGTELPLWGGNVAVMGTR